MIESNVCGVAFTRSRGGLMARTAARRLRKQYTVLNSARSCLRRVDG
jgi:hypothetical protein